MRTPKAVAVFGILLVFALRVDCRDKVEYQRLVGVFLAVFKHAESEFSVSDVETNTVGTGIMRFGNKGGAAISLSLNDFRLCIINSHLAAGQGEVKKRNLDYQSISKGMKFRKAKNLFDHDAVIWMGDMNSRLETDKTHEDVIHMINMNQYGDLFRNDQLRQQRQEGASFVGFDEMTPTFKPTYKFDPGTSTYDTSPKKRKPAWCDRILIWKKSSRVDIRQLSYTSKHDVVLSDHKPVQASIKLNLAVPR